MFHGFEQRPEFHQVAPAVLGEALRAPTGRTKPTRDTPGLGPLASPGRCSGFAEEASDGPLVAAVVGVLDRSVDDLVVNELDGSHRATAVVR